MDTSEERSWREAYKVLGELLEIDAGERRARLESLSLDAELRDLVRQLLDSASTEGPLDTPIQVLAGAFPEETVELPGQRVIGGWRLGRELGRGGMGVVYRVTREAVGFEQTAALKVLRLGMSDPAAIARFEREQQILARLEHPDIAGLIDGGVMADGSPFLVLQEVDGLPIDEACAERGATAREIVEWMVAVCRAVAYAHGHLIIHRDLKPANILVDRQGRVRLLDFGVAKLLDEDALGHGSSETTTTRILTPGYGAPEQHSGDAVTTATDVYGVGAVLYRLLAGRSLRETPAASPRPSASSRSVAGVDEDLDNIVMMALRDEPSRRYPSAEAVADDLQRWRDRLPVRATPDRLGYRLGKLLRRHWPLAVTSGVAAASLLVGATVALWQGSIARQEAHRARTAAMDASRQLERAEEVTRFLVTAFSAADPRANSVEEVTAREILDAGTAQIETALEMAPAVRRELRSVLGELAYWLGDFPRAEDLLAKNLVAYRDEEVAAVTAVDRRIQDLRFAARSAWRAGQLDLAEERFGEALALAPRASLPERLDLELFYAGSLIEVRKHEAAAERIEGLIQDGWMGTSSPRQEAAVHSILASAYAQLGRLVEAKEQGEHALDLFEVIDHSRLDGPGGASSAMEQAGIEAILANVEADLGNLHRAEVLMRKALDTRSVFLGPQHADVLVLRNDLATLLKNLGRFEESASMLESVLADQTTSLGEQHPYLAYTHFNLAEAQARAADPGEESAAAFETALRHYRQAVTRAREQPEAFGPAGALFTAAYGHALGRAGHGDEAEIAFREALEGLDGDHPLTPRLGVLYASFLNDRGRGDEARPLVDRAVAALVRTYGEGSREHALALLEHGRALADSQPVAARTALEEAVANLRGGPFHRQYAREIAVAEAALARLVAE